MPALTIGGVVIAEIDAETARFLLQVAQNGPGRLAAPVQATLERPDVRDMRSLAGGSLMEREHSASAEVAISLRFVERSTRIENTVARLLFGSAE